VKGGNLVLVTGGTGFVGSHLVKALSARELRLRVLVRRASNVTRLVESGAELIEGGLDDPAALARAVCGVDVVFHLAAATRARSEREYNHVNAEGTRALVEAVLSANPLPCRLIYLSSLAAAGPARDARPVGLEDLPQPITAYGRSKLAGEKICLAAAGKVEVTFSYISGLRRGAFSLSPLALSVRSSSSMWTIWQKRWSARRLWSVRPGFIMWQSPDPIYGARLPLTLPGP
jgi:nucleoside-diphosphate-sugar epimerase